MYPRPPPPLSKSRGANHRGAQSLNDLSGGNTNQKLSGKFQRPGPPHVRPPLLRPMYPPQQLPHPLHPPHPHHPAYLQRAPYPHQAGPYNDQGLSGMNGPPGPYNPHMPYYHQPNHGGSPSPHDDNRWQNYNYPPNSRQGPQPLLEQCNQAPQPRFGQSNLDPQVREPNHPDHPQWYSGVSVSTTPTNNSGTGHPNPGRTSQDARNGDQSVGARNKFININSLLIALLKAPDQKLAMDQICCQFSCSIYALTTVCFQNSNLFKEPLQGNKSVVELWPHLEICEDYLGDSGCRKEGHCGKLHICLSFVKNMCSSGKDCDFGHNWKSSHNSQLWSSLKMETLVSYTNLLRSLVKKVIVSNESMSVCTLYNNGSCTNESCSALHICSSTVFGGAKCDTDKCFLNHDIFDPQCKTILKYYDINLDDSKRDVITKVRVEIEKQSQEKQAKKEQAHSKNSTWKITTAETGGKTSAKSTLSFFSSIADQEDAVRSIVRSLLVTTDFWNSTEQMYQLVKLTSSDLRSLIEHYSHVFRIHVSGLKVLFKLRPHLQMCKHYNQSTGCDAGNSCLALHLCQKFVLGNCNMDSCELHHSLLAQQNKDIIKRCFIDGVPQKLVLNYFKRRFSIPDVPNICIPYNEERCNAIECDDLHICSDQLFTASSCFKSSCVLNHNLFDEENEAVLKKYNFKNFSQREIVSVLSLRINPSFGNKVSTKLAAIKHNSSTTKIKACKPKAKTSNTETVKPKAPKRNPTKPKASKPESTKIKTDSAPAPKGPVINSSYALEGNVARPEICLDALASCCQPDSQGCPKLHSRVSYHWQFALDNLWYNFSVNHSNAIEAAFRDVFADTVTLAAASYGRTPAEKQMFAFMEKETLVVDFDLMGLTTKRSLKVRRLATPSSVTSKSSFSIVYGWYFKDKNNQWIEYGNSDSTTQETHSSSETSSDIEMTYLSNMNGSLYITTQRFNYTLDFTLMQQTNESTKVVRDIRRRPKYALIEKLFPNDPYGLKSGNSNQSPSSKSDSDRMTSSSSREANARHSREGQNSSAGGASQSGGQNPSSQSGGVGPNGGPGASSSEGGMGPDFPPFWKNMRKDGVESFTVDMNSQEALHIISSILLTMPNAEVTKIRRLQNTFHWEGFSNQMDYFKIATKKPLNIQRLFHGTKEKYVDSISAHNFEWRQSFADNGNMYGRGAYFFNNAAVAHSFANGPRAHAVGDAVVLAIADVFVGSVAVGTSEMTRPPPKQTGSPDLYHTTVNDLSLPTIFVKYDKSHYCPHYFVDLKP